MNPDFDDAEWDALFAGLDPAPLRPDFAAQVVAAARRQRLRDRLFAAGGAMLLLAAAVLALAAVLRPLLPAAETVPGIVSGATEGVATVLAVGVALATASADGLLALQRLLPSPLPLLVLAALLVAALLHLHRRPLAS